MKRRLTFICSTYLLIFLVACSPHRPDTSTFDLAPDLRVNPELDGLVMMTVEVELGALVETIENSSEFLIGLGHPFLEYFDGENWRIVPKDKEENFAFLDILLTISSNNSETPSLNSMHLDFYDHPRRGRFRVRRSVFPEEGYPYPSPPNRHVHDLTYEFLLD